MDATVFKVQIDRFETDARAGPRLHASVVVWLAAAAALFAVRATLYGPGLTASFRALLGIAGRDPFGPVNHTIDILDPALVVAALGAAMMAIRSARSAEPGRTPQR